MNIQSRLLNKFKKGEYEQAKDSCSPKTYYRYLRMWMLIQIQNLAHEAIDFNKFDSLKLPRLRQIVKEMKEW